MHHISSILVHLHICFYSRVLSVSKSVMQSKSLIILCCNVIAWAMCTAFSTLPQMPFLRNKILWQYYQKSIPLPNQFWTVSNVTRNFLLVIELAERPLKVLSEKESLVAKENQTYIICWTQRAFYHCASVFHYASARRRGAVIEDTCVTLFSKRTGIYGDELVIPVFDS